MVSIDVADRQRVGRNGEDRAAAACGIGRVVRDGESGRVEDAGVRVGLDERHRLRLAGARVRHDDRRCLAQEAIAVLVRVRDVWRERSADEDGYRERADRRRSIPVDGRGIEVERVGSVRLVDVAGREGVARDAVDRSGSRRGIGRVRRNRQRADVEGVGVRIRLHQDERLRLAGAIVRDRDGHSLLHETARVLVGVRQDRIERIAELDGCRERAAREDRVVPDDDHGGRDRVGRVGRIDVADREGVAGERVYRAGAGRRIGRVPGNGDRRGIEEG